MHSRAFRSRASWLVFAVLTAVSFSVVAACGDEDGGGSPGGDDAPQMNPMPQEPLLKTPDFVSEDNVETTLDVVWNDDLTIVELDALDALIDYDWASQTYVFDRQRAQDAGLTFEVGRPLLIAGLTLRTIASVDTGNGRITVKTTSASLEDAIDEGELGVSYDMEFSNEMFEYSTMRYQKLVAKDGVIRIEQPVTVESDGVTVTVNADGSTTFAASVGPYEYSMDFSMEGDQFRTAFNITRGPSDSTKVRYYLQGKVRAPSNRLNATFSGGKLQTYDFDVSGLSGEVTLGIIAAGSTPDEFSIDLPAPLFRVPILIGGVIPAVIEIDVALAFNSVVPVQAQASVQLKNTFTFDGTMGYSLEAGAVKPHSGLTSYDLLNGSVDLASKFTPVNASLTVGFPRVGISILGNSVSGAVQPIFGVEGQLTFGPVCQKAALTLRGNGKFNISAFGLIPIASGTTDFFEKKERKLQDSCEQD